MFTNHQILWLCTSKRYSNRICKPNLVYHQSCGPTVLTCWPYKHRRGRVKRFCSLRMGTKGLLHIDEYLYENEQYNHRCGEWDIGPDPCYWHGLEQHLIQKHQTGFHSMVIYYNRHVLLSSTTSLDAVKAAGIKVGFLATLSASHYTSYASDSKYIVGGMNSTITTYVSQVVTTLFCPACKFLIDHFFQWKIFSNIITKTRYNFLL